MNDPMRTAPVMIRAVRDLLCRNLFGARILHIASALRPPSRGTIRRLLEHGCATARSCDLPNAVAYQPAHNRLILVEIAVLNGPIDAERSEQLRVAFQPTRRHFVLVTAFGTMREFADGLRSLSWGTSAWVADAPDHLIVFNGRRLIGPRR
jgi:hypothetical protein